MQFMQEEGNLAAKAIYEKCVPAFFYRPQENDCMWDFFFPFFNKITEWLQEKWIKPLVDRRVEEAKEEDGCWGQIERCRSCEFCPSICDSAFLFFPSAFWGISGSGQSMNGENLPGKTYHRHTPQVIANIALLQAAELRMHFCARLALDCVSLTPDQFESTLWKKGKDNKNFLRRVFLLSRNDFTLRYFVKGDVSGPLPRCCCIFEAFFFWFFLVCRIWYQSVVLNLTHEPQSKAPKAVISMKDLNAVFQPEKVSHSHGLQISYTQEERMRNLFVYHEDGQVSTSATGVSELWCYLGFFACLSSTRSHFSFYVQVPKPVAFRHRRHSQKFRAACLTYRWSCLCSMLSEQHGWHTCKRNTRPCETST